MDQKYTKNGKQIKKKKIICTHLDLLCLSHGGAAFGRTHTTFGDAQQHKAENTQGVAKCQL
jgi:hypothetical protein